MFKATAPTSPKVPRPVPYAMWKMRDGSTVRVVDMSDKHLFNTIRMLERGANKKAHAANMAQMCIDRDEYYEYEQEDILKPIYKIMVAVAKARGIEL